ncbi:prepilin protein [Bordetella ansorpii]|uniref:Prepilin protein n=1 Tax=Bordetella ansorpii TaxID=288768 RepID=A0A157RHB3_9BORD|nr:prepilin-type N-terminal cleavage/methylation domain-containing protein [Bordetella ansorpii]SAI57392.1 prepilin protein [Bordetella ansorpii]
MSASVSYRYVRSAGGRARRGFALIELSIALLVGTLLAVWGSAALMRRADDVAAQATGKWLLEIRHAASRMLERHFDALAAGSRPVDEQGRWRYADPMAPTLAEFRSQGLLPAGFPETAAGGAQARIRLFRPNACPGANCRVEALVYSTQALQGADGTPDAMRLAELVAATEGHGGHATAASGGRLRGAAFDFANPYAPGAAVLPAGTPVLWAGMDLATADRYVRRFDSRDPQLQGSLTTSGSVVSGGRLISQEYLLLGVATVGQACNVSGLAARSNPGGMLTCRNGAWAAEDGGFGGGFAENNRFGCHHYTGISTANPRTGACSCPAGYSAVIISAGGKWNDDEGWTTGYICVR